MNIINLTPHKVVITAADGAQVEVPADGRVPRLVTELGEPSTVTVDGHPVEVAPQRMGAVTEPALPAPEGGTLLLVPILVAQAYPERGDLVAPGELIRDEGGAIIGCRGLVKVAR